MERLQANIIKAKERGLIKGAWINVVPATDEWNMTIYGHILIESDSYFEDYVGNFCVVNTRGGEGFLLKDTSGKWATIMDKNEEFNQGSFGDVDIMPGVRYAMSIPTTPGG